MKRYRLSRRKFLDASLKLPFLSAAGHLSAKTDDESKDDSEFTTMLTSEGKAVKVRTSELKDAKVIKEKLSNESLLNWLKPKEFTSKK
ncbi:MAG: hypothetical protein HYX66_07740 [Ignavibacteria bacterium]|jgi:cobalamin biosynthesis Co2+ chelatase CbiK|nr:hypothetical protein [Ignavibacteria bacterium]